MPDREKVIKGMRMCISPVECSPDDCPYYIRPNNESGLCWDRLMTDALALIKEQQEAVEPKTGHWIWLQYCANEGVYCSECHKKMFDCYPMKKKLSQFCGHCGAKMDDEVEGR